MQIPFEDSVMQNMYMRQRKNTLFGLHSTLSYTKAQCLCQKWDLNKTIRVTRCRKMPGQMARDK